MARGTARLLDDADASGLTGVDEPPIAVGDMVVYAAHGLGRVVASERIAVGGAERDCVVVDLPAGLRVTLSFELAASRLRAVADEGELARVQRTLAAAPGPRDGTWLKRVKASRARLVGGQAADLAALVRDGSASDRREPGCPRLSPGERRLYLHARQLLVRELSWAREVSEDEADAWIDAQTVRTERGEG